MSTDVLPHRVPGPAPTPKRASGCLLKAALGVGGLVLLVAVLLPNLCKSTETSNRAKCASNLHQIGLAILMYQQDHGGLYPDTLGRLSQTEQVGAEVFTCPSGNEEKSTADNPAADVGAGPAGHHCSYLYFGRGFTGTVPAETVIACDAPDEHDRDGVNVLYGDGHADWEMPSAVIKLLPRNLIPDDRRWRRAATEAGIKF